uniref:Uncharacterized protein n=1 Tax=Sphaerodactylus townsendi TaxID=933632 RepID=A0ACB8E7P2_9SAUR
MPPGSQTEAPKFRQNSRAEKTTTAMPSPGHQPVNVQGGVQVQGVVPSPDFFLVITSQPSKQMLRANHPNKVNRQANGTSKENKVTRERQPIDGSLKSTKYRSTKSLAQTPFVEQAGSLAGSREKQKKVPTGPLHNASDGSWSQ